MLSAMAASELTFMLRDMPGIISRMLAVSLRFTLYRDWFMPDEERVEQNSLYTLPAGVKVPSYEQLSLFDDPRFSV